MQQLPCRGPSVLEGLVKLSYLTCSAPCISTGAYFVCVRESSVVIVLRILAPSNKM